MQFFRTCSSLSSQTFVNCPLSVTLSNSSSPQSPLPQPSNTFKINDAVQKSRIHILNGLYEQQWWFWGNILLYYNIHNSALAYWHLPFPRNKHKASCLPFSILQPAAVREEGGGPFSIQGILTHILNWPSPSQPGGNSSLSVYKEVSKFTEISFLSSSCSSPSSSSLSIGMTYFLGSQYSIGYCESHQISKTPVCHLQNFMFHDINTGLMLRILMVGHTKCATNRDKLKTMNDWQSLKTVRVEMFCLLRQHYFRTQLCESLSAGGEVPLALLHSCSVVNIFILSLRVGFGQRGTSHSRSAALRDHSGWCDCKKHFHLRYGSQLISSSVASALFFPRAQRSLTAHFHVWMCIFVRDCVSPSHVPAPLRTEQPPPQTQSPNSLTCQSIWTWASLSHQVCLACVLMTPLLPEEVSCPLSQFITYLSACWRPEYRAITDLSVRSRGQASRMVIKVTSCRRDDESRAECSVGQESGFQSGTFSQLRTPQFNLKHRANRVSNSSFLCFFMFRYLVIVFNHFFNLVLFSLVFCS